MARGSTWREGLTAAPPSSPCEGEYYKLHHDWIPEQLQALCGPRVYTFFLYLSDVEEGGGTQFPYLKDENGAPLTVQAADPQLPRASRHPWLSVRSHLHRRGRALRYGGRTGWRATRGRRMTGRTTRRCRSSWARRWRPTTGSTAPISRARWPRDATAAPASRAGYGASDSPPVRPPEHDSAPVAIARGPAGAGEPGAPRRRAQRRFARWRLCRKSSVECRDMAQGSNLD